MSIKKCQQTLRTYQQSQKLKFKLSRIIKFPVSTSNMSLEIVSLVAAVWTEWASIGFLASVSSLMALQFVAGLKGLAADGAGVVSATA